MLLRMALLCRTVSPAVIDVMRGTDSQTPHSLHLPLKRGLWTVPRPALCLS